MRSLVGAVAAAVLAACAYSTARVTQVPGIRSIAIEQFDNRTFRRDLEMRLTQAVAQEVRARTSYRVASPEGADAVLVGRIDEVETPLLLEDGRGAPVEQRMRAVVRARLVERSTGRVLRDVEAVDRVEWTEGRFRESLDASASDALVRRLAEQVVQGLETPIGDPERPPPPGPRPVSR